jgi:hypothetical protein
MSDLLEYVAVAGGLVCDWAVAGDAIGNGHPNKSLKTKTGVRTPNSLWRRLE